MIGAVDDPVNQSNAVMMPWQRALASPRSDQDSDRGIPVHFDAHPGLNPRLDMTLSLLLAICLPEVAPYWMPRWY